MSLLRIEELTVRFGGLTAVNAVSFEVEPGQIVSVIGPNGAGKTSVFNAITGIHDPTSGRILLEGRDARRPLTWLTGVGLALVAIVTGAGLVLLINLTALWEAAITGNYVFQQPFPWTEGLSDAWTMLREAPASRTWWPGMLGSLLGLAGGLAVWQRARRSPDVITRVGVARTFQNPRLFHQMTVIENVLVGMDEKLQERFWHAALRLPLHRREQRAAIEKAMKILAFVELEDEANLTASALSYGHQRRLEIARALASEPKLLLLDEPAAGMNPSETGELMQLIHRIRERGVTVLLIEHHMNLVMGISDRIVVLDYGNKIAEGPPDHIRADPAVRKAYLGTAEA